MAREVYCQKLTKETKEKVKDFFSSQKLSPEDFWSRIIPFLKKHPEVLFLPPDSLRITSITSESSHLTESQKVNSITSETSQKQDKIEKISGAQKVTEKTSEIQAHKDWYEKEKKRWEHIKRERWWPGTSCKAKIIDEDSWVENGYRLSYVALFLLDSSPLLKNYVLEVRAEKLYAPGTPSRIDPYSFRVYSGKYENYEKFERDWKRVKELAEMVMKGELGYSEP